MADFDELRGQYHRALEAFIQGDPKPVQGLWSKREDVTLANPLGPPARGWDAGASNGACRFATPRR